MPLISLKVLPESADGSSTPPLDVASLQKEIQSLPGVPERIGLSFSQGRFDPEAKAERDSQSNEHALEQPMGRTDRSRAMMAGEAERSLSTTMNVTELYGNSREQGAVE